ncbi:LysE family translocator [Streptomyces lydicus]|uniref:LysE family translocator n=1 Tax=Streptomyces lydicus TaxID=47763 RepID=UPI0037B93BA2
MAAAFGPAAALQRRDAAFTAVRLVGAAYPVLLGGQALWAHRRSAPAAASDRGAGADDAGPAVPMPAEAGPLAPVRAFRQGLLSCLLNPEVGLFFVAVGPQFLPEGHSVLGGTLLPVAVDALIAAGWLLLVVGCAGRVLRRLRRPRVRRNPERATGGC